MDLSSKKKPNLQKLLVIATESDLFPAIREIISELESVGYCNWQIITLGHLPFEKMRKGGIPYKNIDSYFAEEDHFSDYSQATEISNQWFFDSSGNDSTIYHGISIGVILQRWINLFFNNLLSSMRTVERVLKKEKPDEIWLYSSSSKGVQLNNYDIFMGIFYAIAKAKRITCKEKLLHGNTKGIKQSRRLRYFLQKCKSLLYSLVVRRILYFIKYCVMRRGNKDMVNIMLPSPHALNYMGDTIIDMLLTDKKNNVLVWEGETARQKVGLIDISPPFSFWMKRNKKKISARIEKIFIDFIEAASVEELKCISEILKKVYKQQIEPLVKDIIFDIEKIESYFKRENVQLVFSHTDTTIRERVVIGIANKYKVPSVVLQHGAAGHYWGFFPFIATKFAAWGEITDGWFERNGVRREKISITGAANFDSYVQQISNNRKNEKIDWQGISNYLLYVTLRSESIPTGFKPTIQDNEIMLKAVLNAFETLPGRILVIKLRPGDSQTEFYKYEIKRRRLKNVYLVEVTDNRRLLNACGILLTTYSTMALEALLFKKPIIQLKFVFKTKLMKALYHQGILCDEDVIPLAKYGAALGVDIPEELREAILKIYEDKQLRQSIIDKGNTFLRKYCYRPDGKASLRVIQCIDQLIQGER